MSSQGGAAPRIQSIDMIKGLALVLISAGYMNWYIPSNAPFFVFLASIEAPLFYFAAGYTMAIRAEDRPLTFFLARMTGLFIFKAFIDLAIFGILPLVDGSSLVTIGLGCPVIYVFSRLGVQKLFGRWAYLIGCILVVGLMPLLQWQFGYRQLQTNVDYWYNYPDLKTQFSNLEHISDVLRNWFIDGWNPFFPFVGFMLLGSFASGIRERLLNIRPRAVTVLSLASITCYAVWPAFAPEPIPRLGQLETQFPPSVMFTLTFGLLAILILVLFESETAKRRFGFLSIVGRSPLFNFILISALVRLAVYPHFGQKMSMGQFLGIWLLINMAIFTATFFLGAFNKRFVKKDSWLLIRMLAGSYQNSLFGPRSND